MKGRQHSRGLPGERRQDRGGVRIEGRMCERGRCERGGERM